MTIHKVSNRVRKARKKLNLGYTNLSRIKIHTTRRTNTQRPKNPYISKPKEPQYITTRPLSKRQQRKYTVRSQFEKAVNDYKKSVAERQALYDVMNVGTTEQALVTSYTKLNYERLKKEGTYRIEGNAKEGYRRVEYFGDDAIKLQIESLNKMSSKELRKDTFIRNYVNEMRKVGYNLGERENVRRLLKEFSADELNVAIIAGTIPDIYWIYDSNGSDDEYNEIVDKIKKSRTSITPEQQRTREQLTQNYLEILNTKWNSIL